ncbi:MAG: hypothetical protein IKU15_08930 [Clostridia bacterium]|nr:hypothetical protein [Clostridia bacterium]
MKKNRIDWADVGMTITGILFALFMVALMAGMVLIAKHSADHTYSKNAIAISENTLRTDDGNEWEVKRNTLTINHQYEVFFNDNDTPENIYDDIITCVK